MKPSINWAIGFSDFLMVLLSFVLALISVQSKNDGPKTEAEYLITAEWDRNLDVDIDLWGMNPDKTLIWYGNKEAGAIHLDRDSLGFISDRIVDENGSVTYLPHKEIQTIRGLIPGRYVFGIQYYRGEEPVAVHVEVIKIRPKTEVVIQADIVLQARADAANFAAFNISPSGAYEKQELPLTPISDFYYKPNNMPNEDK